MRGACLGLALLTTSACGSGGGLTKAQADHCNQVLAIARPILPATLEPSDGVERVDHASQLTAASDKIAAVYNQESSTEIKTAARGIGVVLVRTSQDLLAKQDLGLDQDQLKTALESLNTACHIKSNA